MNYNHPLKNGSTITIRVMCAIVFVFFSIAWLYAFQADVLAMAQHVLSDGVTHYYKLIGTLVITVVLYLLQLFVYSLTRLEKRTHALTYVPSMLLLAILTDVSYVKGEGVTQSFSWWWLLVIIPVWLFIIQVARNFQQVEDDRNFGLLSRPMWINMLLLALQMMGVTWIGNTNAVFHYRMKVEGYLLEGKYDKALKVGQKSLESDENLLMLRMAAMARQGVLGEHLFEYPITGNSSQMLPTNGQTAMILCPADSLYKFLGAKPGESLEPQRYLELLQRRDSVPEKVIADYLLCGYLIDKKIDQFAQAISHYYQIDAHLPKHYKEALTLYTHLRSQPVVTYYVPEVEEDFSNLQELEKQYPDAQERKVKVSEQYRGTYWYYYRYE